jgi:4-hydroxy-4-methyl-2-oxoglutarate aldolase
LGGIRPGRNEIVSANQPVVISGVLACPGDILAADGDSVIIVPREKAEQVALYDRQILDKDKERRKQLYKEVGLPDDKTVK